MNSDVLLIGFVGDEGKQFVGVSGEPGLTWDFMGLGIRISH